MAPVERLLVVGPDSPALASLIADVAETRTYAIGCAHRRRAAPDVDQASACCGTTSPLRLEDGQVDVRSCSRPAPALGRTR